MQFPDDPSRHQYTFFFTNEDDRKLGYPSFHFPAGMVPAIPNVGDNFYTVDDDERKVHLKIKAIEYGPMRFKSSECSVQTMVIFHVHEVVLEPAAKF
jgi:hypothetical protein